MLKKAQPFPIIESGGAVRFKLGELLKKAGARSESRGQESRGQVFHCANVSQPRTILTKYPWYQPHNQQLA